MENIFNEGDCVKLKFTEHEVPMTVVEVGIDNRSNPPKPYITCRWFDKLHKMHAKDFNPAELKPC